MTQQDDITQRVLPAEHHLNELMRLTQPWPNATIPCATVRSHVEQALSKLRAPAADQRGLLPCPFCGSEAFATFKTGDDDLRRHSVHCKSLDCGGQTRDRHFSEAEAIAAWNRRSALASAPVAVPPGWKLVPIEPTPEMEDAGCDVPCPQDGAPPPSTVYAAMIGAAPPAPGASAPVAGEAQPLGYVCASGLDLLARGDYATILPKSRPGYQFPVYAAPQASTPVGDERAAQEYGSPADVAQRIEQYLAQDGRMNSGTQLLYEAMKALRASQGDRNDG